MSNLKKPMLFVLLGSLLMLAVLLLVGWLQARTRVAVASTTVQLINYRAATTNFFARADRWPTSDTELVTNSMGFTFIDASPPLRDGWGRPIIYAPYTTDAGYGRIVSYGRDGRLGGAGVDADLEQRFP